METTILLSTFGAMLAVGLAGIGSSLGIGTAGTKGAGVLMERPDLFGKILVIMLLPGSQGVYGLLIAVLILFKAGLLGGGAETIITAAAAAKFLAAGFSVGLSGLFSGWYQGRVAASSIGSIARDESLTGRLIGMCVIVETYAIFGLLVALFLVLL